MISLSYEQDRLRLKELEDDYNSLREIVKKEQDYEVVNAFEDFKSEERKNSNVAFGLLIGGPILSLIFFDGFLSGVVATLSAGAGFYLFSQIGLPADFNDFDFKMRPHLQEKWDLLERRRINRNYDRQRWAYKNGLTASEDETIDYEEEEYLENFMPVRPWDTSWLDDVKRRGRG